LLINGHCASGHDTGFTKVKTGGLQVKNGEILRPWKLVTQIKAQLFIHIRRIRVEDAGSRDYYKLSIVPD
jgi:hypothetical protein